MKFIDDHGFQIFHQMRCGGISDQKRHLLGRGDQNIRRVDALTLPPRMRRIACSSFNCDRQFHFIDRRFEIASDINRQRFQWRNIKCVYAMIFMWVFEINECRQKARQSFAAARGRYKQSAFIVEAMRQHLELVRTGFPAA